MPPEPVLCPAVEPMNERVGGGGLAGGHRVGMLHHRQAAEGQDFHRGRMACLVAGGGFLPAGGGGVGEGNGLPCQACFSVASKRQSYRIWLERILKVSIFLRVKPICDTRRNATKQSMNSSISMATFIGRLLFPCFQQEGELFISLHVFLRLP